MNRITAQEAAMLAEEAIQSAIDAIFSSIEAEAKKGKKQLLLDGNLQDTILNELLQFGFTYQYFPYTSQYRINW